MGQEYINDMLKNSTVLTNSEYSRKAIVKAYGIDNIIVLSPPVDIDTFRNFSFPLSSPIYERDDTILVVSRIEPSKRIERAINLAKLLKEKNVGKEMIIVGSLDTYYKDYYSHLKKIIADLNLVDFVTFEIDAPLDNLFIYEKKQSGPFTRGQENTLEYQ